MGLSPFLKDAQKQLPYRTAEDLKTLWAKICKRENTLKKDHGMDLRRFFMFFHAQDGKCASDPSTDPPHPFDSSGVGIQVDHYGLCDEGIPREEWTLHAATQNCMVYYRLKNTGCFRNAADNEAAL